jgi:O-antigen/teichoic acid export membrane protein
MLDKNEGLKEKFIRKGFWIYLFSFIVGPIGYLTKMLLSADLSVEEMGILYGIISFILLIGTYNDLGLTESLNFFLPKFAVEKRYAEFKTALLYAVTAQAASSVLIGGGLFFGAEWLAEAYFKSPAAEGVLKVFCLYFFLSNLLQISSTLFAVVQDTKLQNFLGFIRSTFSLLFIGSLWYF